MLSFEALAAVNGQERARSTHLCYTFDMKIHIRYFASLREITELSEEILTVQDGATVADVRAQLLARFPRIQLVMERSVCAVNRGYVGAETVLHEDDELVFIPPMGGGSKQEK